MITRLQIGALDAISGILFLVGLYLLKTNQGAGLLLIGFSILKQFSGK
ncbi:hypothetical protein ACFLZ7_01930 [Nanoarchaeota archaeon]